MSSRISTVLPVVKINTRLIAAIGAVAGFLAVVSAKPELCLVILGVCLIIDTLLNPVNDIPSLPKWAPKGTTTTYLVTSCASFAIFAIITWATYANAGASPFQYSVWAAFIFLIIGLFCASYVAPKRLWWLIAGIFLTIFGLSGLLNWGLPKFYAWMPTFSGSYSFPSGVYAAPPGWVDPTGVWTAAGIVGIVIIVPTILGYLQVDIGKIGTIIITGVLAATAMQSPTLQAWFVDFIPGMSVLGAMGSMLATMLGVTVCVIAGGAIGRMVSTYRGAPY